MAFTLPSPGGRGNFARVTLLGPRGKAGVGFFRLGIVLDVTVEPGGGVLGSGDAPQLAELAAEVCISGKLVGWFEPPPGSLPLGSNASRTSSARVLLWCDLDRARLEAIETARAGGNLPLDVQLYWRIGEDRGGSNSETMQVNQGVWTEVLGQMGYQQTLLIEVAVPDPAAQPELAEAVRLLGEAQGHMLRGRDRDAVGALRDVLDEIARAFGDDDSNDAVVNALFAKQKTMTKAERLRVVRRALKLATHPARHRDELSVGIDWGRIDSAQMIAMVAAFVNEMGAPGARPSVQPSPAAPGSGGAEANT